MSRSYREYMEQHGYIHHLLYPEYQDRRQAEQGMREWYEDQAAQLEFQSWLDTLQEQRE